MEATNSERLYYHDAYTTQFDARVIEQTAVKGLPAVVLDRTYFYPTSGGQPHDRGFLNEVAVSDVIVRAGDGRILHVLQAPLATGAVHGRIDWPRRFDHMQHHTGQHILSQAFIRVADAHTEGFHLSDTTVTIDLNRSELTAAQVDAAETLANTIIWENRPVAVRLVAQAEAETLALRKVPEINGEHLRLVDITDFDVTACGGTHVAATGAVGLVKIVRTERRGDKTRVYFCCGARALDDYRSKQAVLDALVVQLTTGYEQVPAIVEKLQEENKALQRDLRQRDAELHRLQAGQLLSEARRAGKFRLLTHVFTDRSPGDVRALGTQLCEQEDVIALLGLAAARSHLVFCHTADAPGRMDVLLRQALQALGSKSGGGSTNFAQGAAPAAAAADLEKVIDDVAQILLEEIARMG